jgi:hypothetical protein
MPLMGLGAPVGLAAFLAATIAASSFGLDEEMRISKLDGADPSSGGVAVRTPS